MLIRRKHMKGFPSIRFSTQESSTSSSMKEAYESGEEHSLISLLSDDALILMLRSLPTRELLCSAAFVCKRWHRMCKQYLVYELIPSPYNQSENPWGHMNEAQLFPLAVSHSSSLERLSLQGLKRLTGSDIISLLPKLPKLEDLSIVSCTNLGFEDLEAVCRQLPSHLLSLDLHSFNFATTRFHDCVTHGIRIDDNFVGAIHQRCPKLQKLNLDFCSTVSMKAFGTLLQGCQFLTSLDLHSHELGWPEVAEIFRSCKSLRHFSLVSPLLEEKLEYLGEGRPFRRPDLFINGRTPDLPALPRELTSLRLYRSPNRSVSLETGPMLRVLEEYGPQLSHLHAQGVYNTGWEVIQCFCTNLKLLDLSHCKVEFCSLTQIEEGMLCGLVPVLKKLEYLALPCATDAILLRLGLNCPKLKELRFQGYGLVDNPASFKLVTDAGVVALAEGCPELRVLCLAGCRNITLRSARVIAFHCRRLKVLILNQCSRIRDDAVAVMMPRLSTTLVFLDLIGCKLTRSSCQSIVKYSKETSLRVLAIQGSICPPEFANILGPRLRVVQGRSSGMRWAGHYNDVPFY
ncbi:hypothetical protein Mapa_013335 [Marchantia paleacea]|nr:hypothetical protein Mapa_013335 [Marchantia paleacea]